jgi:quinol monooxygenase YgiN
MFALVVRFDLRPGSEAAFDALVRETVLKIESEEPSTFLYHCHRVDGDEGARVFYEVYRDRYAFDEHERQPHVRRFLNEREQYLAGPPRVEFLAPTVGKGLPA